MNAFNLPPHAAKPRQQRFVTLQRAWLFGLLLLITFVVLLSPAAAATFMVDDSQSAVLNPSLALQWRTIAPSAGDHIVQGHTRVQIKLDVRPWAGKSAHIYMTLPAQPNGVVNATWQAEGPLLSGQLSSGSRGLVWAGVVPAAVLDDVMAVTIQTDGRLLNAAQQLRFNFEIDVP
jgi:hypothetical protein